MSLVVKVVDDEAGFRALEAEWNALLERSATARIPFTFEWNWTCWTYNPLPARPLIVTVRDQGLLVGLWPLRLFTEGPRKGVLEPIAVGYRWLADYHDLLSAAGYETAVVEPVLTHLKRVVPFDVLEWPELNDTSPSYGVVPRAATAAGLHYLVTPGSVCQRILLPATWPEYLARLSPGVRDVERRARKLLREQEARFERVAEAGALEPVLEALHRLQEERWKAQGSAALATYMGFLRRLAPLLVARGWLDVNVLRIAEAPVAIDLGFRLKGVYYGYAAAFDSDPRWNKYGVGTVILASTIRGSIEDGIHTFDLMRGEDAYKARFDTVTSRNHRFRLLKTRGRYWFYRVRESLRAVRTVAQGSLGKARRRSAKASVPKAP